MYTCSLANVFCNRQFSVKQFRFEIYIILCHYSYHSFRVLKIKSNSEINFSDFSFLSLSYGNKSQKSVRCGKYSTLITARFLQLIG